MSSHKSIFLSLFYPTQDVILLSFCALGICVSYLTYGFIQEECFGRDKTIGSVTSFILITQSITNVFVAKLLIILFPLKKEDEGGLNHRLLLLSTLYKSTYFLIEFLKQKSNHTHSLLTMYIASFCFAAAMNATNESLSYVSYPTAVLAKSSKLIPTMIMSGFVDSKTFEWEEIVGAILITGGVVLFNLSRMGLLDIRMGGGGGETTSSAYQGPQKQHTDSLFGIILLLFSLFMDGLLASCQSLLKTQRRNHKTGKTYRPPTAMETMLFTNLYSIPFLLPLALGSGQFQLGMKLIRTPASLFNSNPSSSTTHANLFSFAALSFQMTLLLLNLTAAMGQIFISITIKNFSPQICTTITTTRKFLSIVLSVHRFGHVFTPIQWSAVVMVFGGLRLEMQSAHDHHRIHHRSLHSLENLEKGEKNLKTS
jgi:UDP-galactose transporter B1